MKHTITFEPDNTTIRVDKGANLLEAALAADVHINATCGGQGVCGKCRVVIEAGEVDSEKTEKIDQEEYEAGWRQACKTALLSDCTIKIPVESRGLKRLAVQELDMGKAERTVSVLDTKPLAVGWELDPMTIKLPVELTPPTLKDNVSDLSRFSAGLRQQHDIEDISIDMRCVKSMPEVLRNSDWSVTATLMADPAQESLLSSEERNRPLRLVRIEGGDTSGQNLAVALDVGPTTISALLIDLKAGRVMAEHAEYNKQIQYGADVITRIVFAQKPEGAETLQSVVASSINQVMDELMEQSGSSKGSISCIVSAGNTTMTHLLLGMETRYIREAPYVPAANFMPLVWASDVGIDVPDCVQLCSFPAVASYVGGDDVSGILGSGVFHKQRNSPCIWTLGQTVRSF